MSADAKTKIDVRALSLTQLLFLTERGSRRARAELERRMARADAAHAHNPVDGHANSGANSHANNRVDSRHAGNPVDSPAPAMPSPGNPAAPAPAVREAQVLRLQALGREDELRERAAHAPGLIGMALMGWGALVLCGGLAMLTRRGGLYYVLSGLACAGIGWLLLRGRRAAIWAHLACAAAALFWAWGNNRHAADAPLLALLQSAPVWAPAWWIAAPPARTPLV
jgi:hypothetical protein